MHLHNVFYKCTFETAEISTLVLWKRMTEYFFAKCLERKNLSCLNYAQNNWATLKFVSFKELFP